MIDLTTTYLGLKLKNPIVASSSPLMEDIGKIRQLEDSGAAAVVLHSLFEEQITLESYTLDQSLFQGTDYFSEALSYFPDMTTYNLGPDGYLNHIRLAKDAIGIPVIASLNGVSDRGWTSFASAIEDAGADALELNLYYLPTNPALDALAVEGMYLQLVDRVRNTVRIPIAVKVNPFLSALPNFARRLDESGANGLVLFNRFYQPDFDMEELVVKPALNLSRPEELPLRLRWVAILYGQISADLAITGGVHSGLDVLKCMMAGAKVAMTTSALLLNGIEHLRRMLVEMLDWMEEYEYQSISQMQGSMSHLSVADPSAFERANYMKVLRSYRVERNRM